MPILSNQQSRFIGGGRFTPNKLAGLALWLKADAITGLADGDAIGTWTDSSCSGNNAVQAGADTLKPTYKTDILNSLPVARFDGGDVLDAGKITGANKPANWTLFVVAAVKNVANSQPIVGSVAVSGASASIYATVYNRNSQPGKHEYTLGETATPTNSSYGYSNDTVMANNTFAIHTQRYTSGENSCVIWSNGASKAITKEKSVATASTGAAENYMIGGWQYLDQRLTGDIAEVIVYSSALSDANRQAVEAYLSAKYGIALA